MQFWAIIVDGFRESIDRKIFWVMLIITLIIAVGMACFSFSPGEVSIFFGTWTIETDMFTVAGQLRTDLIASIIVDYIMDLILGSIGIILALIATASFLPTMLESGTIQVLLSKPMPRWKLLVAKYLGSLVFITVQAGIFVTLTFLVAGLRWDVWLPGYLLAIPLITLLFSYLYCVSAFVAVMTKSTIAAILISMGAWVFFSGVQSVDDTFELVPEWQQYETVHALVDGLRWVTPKTQDITYVARKLVRAASPTDVLPAPETNEDRQLMNRATRIELERMKIPASLTIGTSLLFEAVIVFLAIWRFSRQDY